MGSTYTFIYISHIHYTQILVVILYNVLVCLLLNATHYMRSGVHRKFQILEHFKFHSVFRDVQPVLALELHSKTNINANIKSVK